MAEETAVSGYKRFEKAIKKASEDTGIPYHVIDAVIEMESQGKPKARSPKGAVGLMQLMPRTAKILGVNPHNPDENIAGGARYLADMLSQFGTMEKALAAYNAGPVAVRQGRIPRQTRRYVGNVLNLSRAMAPWEVATMEEPALGPTLRRMVR